MIAPALIVLADVVGDGARFLAGLYSFGVLIAMTAAQVAVVRLRVREPELARPVPGARQHPLARGARSRWCCVIGAVLTFALWVASLFTHGGACIAGPGVAGARRRRLPALAPRGRARRLLGRATPAVPDLVADAPSTRRRRILVPLKLSDIGEEVLATAIQLRRGARRRGARAVRAHACPCRSPSTRALDEERGRRARAAIDEVREIAEEHGVEVEARVVRARSLSEAIIAEAARRSTPI